MPAEALWCVAPGSAEIRPASLGEGVELRMLYSGVSRGTERLVFDGRVPQSETLRMRAPGQEGAFPFPVKYGYNAVAEVQEGALAGRTVFTLFPHQTRFRLTEESLIPLPEKVPPPRAVLAANMETALNVLWDSGAGAGDRVAVIGAGVVGALCAYLCARLPGAEVTLCDTNTGRADLATGLDCAFATPARMTDDFDIVIHTSASAAGLRQALDIAAKEATVVEASWHGTEEIALPLGAAFHSRRLRILSSQVGGLPASRRPRWTHRRRLTKAIDLLVDPRLDILISGETRFHDLPARYGEILNARETLCHRIRY